MIDNEAYKFMKEGYYTLSKEKVPKKKRIVCALLVVMLLFSCSKKPNEITTIGSDSLEGIEASEVDQQTEGLSDIETSADSDQEETNMMPPYSHVAVIGVDGAGAFFKDADMPVLSGILAEGAVTYRALTSNPTISAQSWGSLLTGVTPEFHRLSNSLISEKPYPSDSLFPTVFHVIRNVMPEAVMGSFCTWNPINIGIVDDGLEITKGTADSDNALCSRICAYVKEERPTFLFVQFDEVDSTGHSYGYGSAQHLKRLSVTDGYIAKIVETYTELGMLEDTLFIFTADHGGTGKSHGGWTDEEKYIMIGASGRTVAKGSEIKDMEIRDIASVVLMALGLSAYQPESWTARVPAGLFEGVEAKERPVYTVSFVYPHRDHDSTPTPSVSNSASVVSVLGEDRILTYLPFDGGEEPAAGIMTTKQGGKLYYVDGYFGKAAQFDDGFVNLDGWQPGKTSFSVALWMKTGGVLIDPCLLSNKDWMSGLNKGFVLSLRESDVKFNAGNGGQVRMDAEYPLPIDYQDGWVYVVLVVDRENNVIRFSYDFGPFESAEFPAGLKNASLNGLDQLNIGQDGTGKIDLHLSATLDEYLIVDGVLTGEDLQALKACYGG